MKYSAAEVRFGAVLTCGRLYQPHSMTIQILVGFLRTKIWKTFRRFEPTGVENIPEVCPPGKMWIPTLDLSSLKL